VVRSAERERAGDADCAERIEPVGIGERLILERRLWGITRTPGLPVMVLDAGGDGRNLLGREAASGKDLPRERGAPFRVSVAAGRVADVVEQSSGFDHVRVGADGRRDPRGQFADPERMRGVMPGRLAIAPNPSE
jgi:hypothetical protein